MISGRQMVYRLSVTVVLIVVVSLYGMWWWHTSVGVPEMATARPMFLRQDVPVRALLLWREELVRARVKGAVHYTYGSTPVLVGKGDLVATVLKSGKNIPVYASRKGYFVPGLDGLEGRWRYSSLWPGSASLPEISPIIWFSDLMECRSDRIIGKLIPQPQTLRCILYSSLTDSLQSDIQGGAVEIRLNPLDAPYQGNVRVAQEFGPTVKLYLNVPFFPVDMVQSREVVLYVNQGEARGVEIPESSVVIRDGKQGVFVVRRDRASFHVVQGVPMDGGNFFVEAGLNPGSLVLLNGTAAREGRVRLW